MRMTHLTAKELFNAGKIDAAWEVAQLDEGLNEGVTKYQWISWMEKLS